MYEQLLAHLVGDYVLQTDHMAVRKTKSFAVACWHAFVYSIPFFFSLLGFMSSPACHRQYTCRDRPVATRKVRSLGDKPDGSGGIPVPVL